MRGFDPNAEPRLWWKIFFAPPNGDVAWAGDGLAVGPGRFFRGRTTCLYLPSGTKRRGIFAIGPARGTDSAETLAAEIDGALAETRRIVDTNECEVDRLKVDDERLRPLPFLPSCLPGFRPSGSRTVPGSIHWPAPPAACACPGARPRPSPWRAKTTTARCIG